MTIPRNLSTLASGVDTSGVLGAAYGGTAQATYTIGDLLYASGTTALSKLSDVATGNALISGGVGVAPSYGKIGLTTHVSGTLPVGNGGTGTATTFTTGSVVFAGASGVYSQNNSNLFWDNTNSRLGVGTSSPTYKLHVSGSGDTSCFISAVAASNGAGLLRLGGSDTSTYSAYNAVQSINSDGTQQWYIGGNGNTNAITFQTSTSERMRIDSSGNALIGTTTATSKLTVNGDVAGTFFVNPTTVSANYTIPTNYNAMTAGPITVASGVTVTVGSGSTWVVT